MSAGNGTRPRRQRKPFDKDEFTKLHDGLGKLDFTPDFNPSIERIIRDDRICLEARYLLAVKFQSWGNQADFAVHDGERSKTFTQSDFAALLNVGRQRISELTAVLQSWYYLRVEGQKLYPNEDPAAVEEAAQRNVVRYVPDNLPHSLRFFRQEYFTSHPEELREFQAHLAGLNRINQKIRTLYRITLSGTTRTTEPSGTSINSTDFKEERPGQENRDVPDNLDDSYRTESAPSLYKSEISIKGSGPEEKDDLEGETSSSAFPETTTNPPPENAPDQAQISAAVQNYGVAEDELVEDLIERCRQQAPDCTTEEIIHYVQEKGEQIKRDRSIRSPIRFLVTAVPKCFASENYRQYRAQRLSLAAQTNFMSGSPPGRLNYYEEKGNQDFIRDLEREWDDG